MRPTVDGVVRNPRRDPGTAGPEVIDLTDPPEHGAVRTRPVDRSHRWLAACIAIPLVPLVVAVVRSLRSDWMLIGDSAAIAVRADDVLSAHPPVLGLWAYTSLAHGFDYNHPGPLLFDLLALPTAVLGHTTGAVVGNLLLHAAAVTGIVVVAHRRGGVLAAAVASATVSGLVWAMGSAAMVEPWHANSIVLPFLLLALMAWSIALGDAVWLPWAAAVASLVLQTSLSYTVLVPGLAVWGIAGLLLHLRRSRRAVVAGRAPAGRPVEGDGPEGGGRPDDTIVGDLADLRRRVRRRGSAAAVVVAVCWAQPIWEQLTGDGPGNLSLLARTRDKPLTELSPITTARQVVDVGAVPPRLRRAGVVAGYRDLAGGGAIRLFIAGLALVAIIGLFAWLLRSVRRRGDTMSSSLLATAGFVVVLGAVTATRAPAPALSDYQVRWVWPLVAFVVFALATAAAHGLTTEGDAGGPRSSRPVAALVTVAAVLAAFALVPSSSGASSPTVSFGVAARIMEQLDDVELAGPVRLRCAPPTAPYCQAMMAELDGRGLLFLLEDDGAIRSMGDERSAGRHEARTDLLVVSGGAADLPHDGYRRIASNRGVTQDEQLELFSLSVELAGHLAEPADHLTGAGRAALARGAYPDVRKALTDPAIDDEVAFDFGERLGGTAAPQASAMFEEELFRFDADLTRKAGRYVELLSKVEHETVSVFVRDT